MTKKVADVRKLVAYTISLVSQKEPVPIEQVRHILMEHVESELQVNVVINRAAAELVADFIAHGASPHRLPREVSRIFGVSLRQAQRLARRGDRILLERMRFDDIEAWRARAAAMYMKIIADATIKSTAARVQAIDGLCRLGGLNREKSGFNIGIGVNGTDPLTAMMAVANSDPEVIDDAYLDVLWNKTDDVLPAPEALPVSESPDVLAADNE